MMNLAFIHKKDEWLFAMIFVFCMEKPSLEHLHDFCHMLIILIVCCIVQYLV